MLVIARQKNEKQKTKDKFEELQSWQIYSIRCTEVTFRYKQSQTVHSEFTRKEEIRKVNELNRNFAREMQEMPLFSIKLGDRTNCKFVR